MNMAEAMHRLTWLDEEHRRDKAQLAELQQQAEAQTAEILNLTRRLEELEGRLATTQAQLVRFPQIEEALQHLKGEIVAMLEEGETKRQQVEERWKQQAEGQAADLTGLARRLQEVRDELAGAQTQLAQLPPRLDAQATQTTALAKGIEGLHEVLTRAEGRGVELRQRIADQAEQIAHLARGLQGLEGELASTQAQLIKFPQIEEALQHLKNEIVLLLQEMETRRQTSEEEAARARQRDRKTAAKALAELEVRLQPLPQLEERLNAQAAEDKRLGETVLDLQQQAENLRHQIERRTEQVPFLEEHRQRNAEGIAQLQQQVAQLSKNDEEQRAKLRFLEEWGQRSAEKIQELEQFEERLTQDQMELTEAVKLSEDRRQKQMVAWGQELEALLQQRDRWATQMQHFEEVRRGAEGTLTTVQEVKKKVEQEIGEIREVQRLSLTRQTEEMKAWKEEDARRWGQRASEWQWHREKQDERNEEQARRIKELETQCQGLQDRILDLWRAQEELVQSQVIEVQQRLERFRKHLPKVKAKHPPSEG